VYSLHNGEHPIFYLATHRQVFDQKPLIASSNPIKYWAVPAGARDSCGIRLFKIQKGGLESIIKILDGAPDRNGVSYARLRWEVPQARRT
jgi:hypothetical protein